MNRRGYQIPNLTCPGIRKSGVMFECYALLAALAQHTKTMRIGSFARA